MLQPPIRDFAKTAPFCITAFINGRAFSGFTVDKTPEGVWAKAIGRPSELNSLRVGATSTSPSSTISPSELKPFPRSSIIRPSLSAANSGAAYPVATKPAIPVSKLSVLKGFVPKPVANLAAYCFATSPKACTGFMSFILDASFNAFCAATLLEPRPAASARSFLIGALFKVVRDKFPKTPARDVGKETPPPVM